MSVIWHDDDFQFDSTIVSADEKHRVPINGFRLAGLSERGAQVHAPDLVSSCRSANSWFCHDSTMSDTTDNLSSWAPKDNRPCRLRPAGLRTQRQVLSHAPVEVAHDA
ncbi:hypothetical protein [Rathayibacter soli]|uniref:hypothetical protein n=1 Tax=Rathayibacter soli TaxID=3144168 RepID=UPI0027E59B9B|nr:hypothetical protein [Glaciibacter superstes]